jgi:hypothetical protein
LARIATEHTPDALRKAAERLMALVHPDGDFSDADRARRRGLTIGNQEADGMSKISGLLDPEARATIDAVLAKWAAPGMCNAEGRGYWKAFPRPADNCRTQQIMLSAGLNLFAESVDSRLKRWETPVRRPFMRTGARRRTP